MENNTPRYKPGQFVRVNAPGKYRMAFAKDGACPKCDLSGEYCPTKHNLFGNNQGCVKTLGWNGYLVKVK